MKLRSDDPLWLDLATSDLACEPPSQNLHCDVLIVGSGITGALIAHELVSTGMDVVVVDKRPIARGSTAASTALLLYELDSSLTELSRLRGVPDAQAAYRCTYQALLDLRELVQDLDLPCDFAERPSLYLARAADDVPALRAEAQARREIGIDAELLDQRRLQQEFGINRPAAILSSRAMEIDPLKFTRALWRRSIAAGARVFGQTPLADRRWKSASPSVKTATGHTIDCEHVVFATGYEAPEMFPELFDLCTLTATFALATPPVDPSRLWPGRAVMWEMAERYLYLRTTADGRVIIGGEDVPFTGELPGAQAIEGATHRLLSQLGDLFPQLAGATADYAWTGVFASTPDGLPYIGPIDLVDRCYLALGYGGNGITFSTIAAQVVCDEICGRPNDTARLFSFSDGR